MTNQQNQTTNANQQNNNSNPFNRSRPLSGNSRFGSSSNRQSPFNNNSNASSNTNNNANNQSRFGSSNLRNRLNNNQNPVLEWTVQPFSKSAVSFRLNGLGDPFHRLLGTELNVDYGDPAKAAEALQEDEELREKLTELLDEAWEKYAFEGAAFLYPWEADIRQAFTKPPAPLDPRLARRNKANNKNNNNNANNNANNNNQNQTDDDDLDYEDDDDELVSSPFGSSQSECLRAIDLALVINVLARTRANVLVAGTPLALEPGFLTQTFICDDLRIVGIARATGCIEEAW